MSVYVWFVVILVTFMCLVFGVGWMLEHADRRVERLTLLAQLDAATTNVQLPRAGYLPGPQFAEPPMAPVPWELASAAYVLGQQRADQDEVSREVDAIFAEVEHNPERWQR